MDLQFFLKGALLGFAIAAPVGPIGVLCIRKTLQYGRWPGLFSGLGAALADTVYGAIAALGLTFISDFLLKEQFWLRSIGCVFLLYLGWRTFCAKTNAESRSVSHKTLIGDLFSTFFLTIANPMTILSYLAIFAGLGLAGPWEGSFSSTWLVFGVFVGSSLWWLILSEGVTLFRRKINKGLMVWINRIAGLIIAGFGLAGIVVLFLTS